MQAALSGLKEVKVAFDLQNGDGKTLLKQLEVIDETRQSLIEQGVKPQFVLTFRGPATALVQTDQSQIKPENREYASKIAEKIHALRARRRGQQHRAMCRCGPPVRHKARKRCSRY